MRKATVGLAVLLGAFAASVRAAEPTPQAARTLHERLITLDTHLDTPANFLRPGGWDVMARHAAADSKVDYPRMAEGGLDGGFWALYTPQGPRTEEGYRAAYERAAKTAANIDAMAAKNPGVFALAYRADDAARIAAAHKRIVYKSIENAYPLGRDAKNLDEFYARGVRIIGLVHTTNNDWADSATDKAGPEWHGLSPIGRQLVREANRLGVALDASHASDEVFDQLIALSKTPIILTHSGCKAVYDHPRNIDDARLRKLAASGGVIQMNSLYSGKPPEPSAARVAALAALNAKYGPVEALKPEQRAAYAEDYRKLSAQYPPPTASFEDYMRQILHALRVAGVDHVGIGADWDGGGGVTGMEDVSMIPKITERLLQAGYKERDLRKIWGGNTLRLLRKAEREAAYEKQPRRN